MCGMSDYDFSLNMFINILFAWNSTLLMNKHLGIVALYNNVTEYRVMEFHQNEKK